MNTPVTIRPATRADADAIARVHVTAWQVGYRGLIDDGYLDSLDVAEWADQNRTHMTSREHAKEWLVAEGSGEIFGFTSYGQYRTGRHGDKSGSTADGEVHAMYVHPDHWGAGTGRKLLSAAVGDLSARGCDPIRLWTPTGNARARRFYERYGFATDAEGVLHLQHHGTTIALPTVRYALHRAARHVPGG